MIRAVIICLALTAPAHAERIAVCDDYGGYLNEYLEQRARWILDGVGVHFCGRIASAATAYISIPNSCTEPDATFGFHAARMRGGHPDPIGTSMLSDTYPMPLWRWYWSSGAAWLYSNETLDLTADDLVRMGALEMC